jgi:hypothetical protein
LNNVAVTPTNRPREFRDVAAPPKMSVLILPAKIIFAISSVSSSVTGDPRYSLLDAHLCANSAQLLAAACEYADRMPTLMQQRQLSQREIQSLVVLGDFA